MLPKKILLLRFSAMGDVVLLVPVLRSLTNAYPEVEVTVVTRPKFTSFFANIAGVSTFAADVDQIHKGPFGLFRLFRELQKQKFEVVIDLHDHIRTKLLRTYFFLAGTPVVCFDKGRSEKKKLTRRKNKATQALAHTVERYHRAFKKAGFNFPILNGPHLHPHSAAQLTVRDWLHQKSLLRTEKWIGLAPFAMHQSKIWPIENYRLVISNLLSENNFRFFCFGGGKQESEFFEKLVYEFPNNVINVVRQLPLDAELALMQQVDLILCVDSSNMHFAALVGTPILSIWGGTHTDAGFGPFQREASSIIQISRDDLPCRPCSVYGKETCHRGDFACMTRITPEVVTQRILETLPRKS
jgi:ADP-heptose:LPS heptosyltransferase